MQKYDRMILGKMPSDLGINRFFIDAMIQQEAAKFRHAQKELAALESYTHSIGIMYSEMLPTYTFTSLLDKIQDVKNEVTMLNTRRVDNLEARRVETGDPDETR